MSNRSALLLTLLAMAACGAPPTTPGGRYLGTATPFAASPLCRASKAEAQIKDGTLILAPDEGTWILEGLLNTDGTVSADKTQQGANKQPWVTTFEGHWTPTSITGTYKTPRCTFTIGLEAT